MPISRHVHLNKDVLPRLHHVSQGRDIAVRELQHVNGSLIGLAISTHKQYSQGCIRLVDFDDHTSVGQGVGLSGKHHGLL